MINTNTAASAYNFDAYGNKTSGGTLPSPYSYNGYYTDSETGFFYLNARYYDPTTQQFTQEDTYWGDGTNLYAYCGGNPVMYSDPSGHYKTVKSGSRGEDVKTLQRILNANGAQLAVDGSFGPKTLAAVKNYQASHGLAVDGSVGPLTWGSLTKSLAPASSSSSGVSASTSSVSDSGGYVGGGANVGGGTSWPSDNETLRYKASTPYLQGFVDAGYNNRRDLVDSLMARPLQTLYTIQLSLNPAVMMFSSNADFIRNVILGSNDQRMYYLGGLTEQLVEAAITYGIVKGASKAAESKIGNLSKGITEWVGKDGRLIKNGSGDTVLISKDGTRRVRFDINNPSPHNNPHGHVEELVNGKWQKSGPLYPVDVPQN